MNDIKRIKPLTRVTSLAFAAIVILAVVSPVVSGGTMPRFWPLVIGVLSAAMLYLVRSSQRGSSGLMRIGFYIGLFAFFVAFPLLSPDEINPDIADDVHWTLGWALFLSVMGFEVAYWLVGVIRKSVERAPIRLQPSWKQRRLLLLILGLGLTAWFFSVWDYSRTINAPIVSVLLSMRGAVEGASDEATKPGYLSLFLGSGIFLSAVASALLLTLYRLTWRSTVLSWAMLIICAGVGFLSGSRALFLYSFVPVAITGWKKLSNLRFLTSLRWPGLIAAGALIIVVWSAMTVMRGADIRTYEGSIEELASVTPAQSALDIYSMTAVVVETFPDRIPFVNGESLVPLVLGWVPRTLWPSKPYPFGLYMNIINGETLQVRSASLAVGLIGEGYGNFGLLGAFLWAFLVGLACRQGDKLIARFHPDDPLHLLLGGMAMVWIAMIVRGGVPEMFYMGAQILVFPVILARFLFFQQKSAKRNAAPFSGARGWLSNRPAAWGGSQT